jgi:hypothetical protein
MSVMPYGSNYDVLQYPYIPQITNNDFMSKYALSSTQAPYVIPKNQVTTLPSTTWIPFSVDFNYDSLSPTTNNVTSLGVGSLSIPAYLPGSTSQFYLNFNIPQTADQNCVIEVIAQPTSDVIIPNSKNSIIQFNRLYQNTTQINDAVVQLTAL